MLVAEDEEPLRGALCDLVWSEPGLGLVGAACDADEAIETARTTQPDVAILDVRMPGGGGPRAARVLAEISPHTAVLALSAHEDRATVLEMLRAGAVGYVVKGVAVTEIVEAIHRAARGQASLPAAIAADVIASLDRELDERREDQALLRSSEERARALLDSAPDAILGVDAAGRITLANARAEELFGYDRSELLGQTVEALLPPEARAAHVAQRGAYENGAHGRPMGTGLDLRARRRDGTVFPADIALDTIGSGDELLVTAFVRDISDHRRVEELRRRSDDRFAALIESAPDGVVILDPRGTIALVNGRTEALFGYDRGELLGRPLEMLLPARHQERHAAQRAVYDTDPRARPMGVGLDLCGRRKDGTEFPLDVSLSTIDTEDGRLAIAFVRDITAHRAAAELQRRLAEHRAVLARLVSVGEEERRRIAGDIHDDSLQAITAAGMRLQMLRRELHDPAHVALLDDLEETIRLSIRRLRNLLFDLRPPGLEEEGLGAALRMYLDQARRQAPTDYRLEDRLESEPSGDAPLILFRIAQEALTNVRKHARAERVDVTLGDRDDGTLVRIVDDGVGFSVADAGPIPGHLGLIAMRERAELVGGWLRIDSAPGGGTTIEFWIPDLAHAPVADGRNGNGP